MFLARDATSNPPPENRGPSIIEALWILMFIASIVMVARFYVRSQIVKRISADDWVMLFSFVSFSLLDAAWNTYSHVFRLPP